MKNDKEQTGMFFGAAAPAGPTHTILTQKINNPPPEPGRAYL